MAKTAKGLWGSRILLLLLLLVVALGIDAGLGSASGRAGAHRGGSVTFLAAGDVDSLDPGATYYTFGYMVLYATNRTLYSYKPGSLRPVPDLATGPPLIAKDDRTITVHIKSGIRYSPPLQKRVVSSQDIKYAIERAFTANVANGYAFSYFSSIVGAPAAAGAYKPISGIATPNPTTIVFHLKRPDAVSVAQALVMPITVPVPKSYAFSYDQQSPSTYGQHVVYTGPYMVSKYVPGSEIDLVRNPSWNAKTDYRPAYLNSITIQERNTDQTLAVKSTLTGSDLLCCDFTPPIGVLGYARAHYRSQLAVTQSLTNTWIALNTRLAPLTNLDVRRAIVAALDRRALLGTRGPLAGHLANGYLPAGIPGFQAAGGYKQNTNLDFMKSPSGNMAVAKKYMLAARRHGVAHINADGVYTGPPVNAVSANDAPDIATSQTAQKQLAKLGFQLNLIDVSETELYTHFCTTPQVQKTDKIAFCMNVEWAADYSDPAPLLTPTFDGSSIVPTGNVNFSLLNSRAINTAIAKASRLPVGPKRNNSWAKVNQMIAAAAPGAPYMWSNAVSVASKNLKLVANRYYGLPDLNFTSIR
jgi:peptide/nickel transport system substrate-binding protein